MKPVRDRDRQRRRKAARKRRREAKRLRAQEGPRAPRRELVSGGAARPGRRKLSAVLWEFAMPLLEPLEERTLKDVEFGVMLAMAVWNSVSVDQGREGDAAYRDAVAELRRAAKRDADEILPIVAGLRQRKFTLFADDRRLALKHDLTETDDGFHLTVLGSVDAPDTAPSAGRGRR